MIPIEYRHKEGTLAPGRRIMRTLFVSVGLWLGGIGMAGAVWNGLVNPPSGQPEGTNRVFVELPGEEPQQAVDEDECNRRAAGTDDVCPPGYDWYVTSQFGLRADLSIRIEYRDFADESIGRGGGKVGLDGNLNHWSDFQVRYNYDWRGGDQSGEAGSTGPSGYSDWRTFDVGAQYKLKHDYFFRGLGNFEGAYGDAGDSFYSSPDGFQPSFTPPSDYWPGLDWSMGDAMDSVLDDPSSLFADGFESGDVTSWGEVTGRYQVDYEIKADGWYGRQLGIDRDLSADTFIAPASRQPRYEIGSRAGFTMPLALKFGYVDGKIQGFAPDGSTFGSYVPSEQTRNLDGIDIQARYRFGDDFTISGNYNFVRDDKVEYYTPSFDGYLPGDVFADWLAEDPATSYVQIEICDKVLEGGGGRGTKVHLRLTPPSAADFVNNPDEPRSRWHPDYDGALPIVVKADAGKAAIGEALGRLVNAAESWFVASGPAARLGADSVVGQGGTSVVTGPSPEVAVGDDDCNRAKTVIVPGNSTIATTTDAPGDGTKTRPPCDCKAQKKAVADAQTAFDKAEKALKDAQEAYKKAKAQYDRIDQQFTAAASDSPFGLDPKLPTDRKTLEKMNADAVKASDAAYSAEKAAQTARDTAKAALDSAKKALAACQAKCPTAGESTAPGGVAGPTGPATTTDGDKDKPCDCKAKEKAAADADKAYKAAQKAAKEAKAAHEASKVEYDEMSRSNIAPEDQKKYDEVVKATDKAYEARKKAEKAEKDAKAALDAAKKALEACKKECPTAGGGTAAPTGPQGPATTTDGDKDKACDCKKEQAEVDRLRKAYQDALKESTRAERAVEAAKEVEKAASGTADEASRKAEEARTAVEADAETQRQKYAKALKTAQNREMDFRRAEADRLAAEREATDAATKAENLRKQWAQAQKALEACQKKCGK